MRQLYVLTVTIFIMVYTINLSITLVISDH